MARKMDRPRPQIAVVDRADLAATLERAAQSVGIDAQVSAHTSVLEVIGESGPQDVAGLLASVSAAGPFLQDLLRWTDREGKLRVPSAVVGGDDDADAVNAVVGHDHVRWIDNNNIEAQVAEWLKVTVETFDLRTFRHQHDTIATQLREARTKLFFGTGGFVPPEGPPCGPPLPTNIDEILPLRDARAQFERGLIRAAIRERGSLKDASSALGISYTSLWRRLR